MLSSLPRLNVHLIQFGPRCIFSPSSVIASAADLSCINLLAGSNSGAAVKISVFTKWLWALLSPCVWRLRRSLQVQLVPGLSNYCLKKNACLSLSLSLSLARKIGGSMLAAPLTTICVGNLFFCRLLLCCQTATRVVNYVCVRIMLLRLNN